MRRERLEIIFGKAPNHVPGHLFPAFLYMSAGQLVVGRIHKFEHPSHLVSGDLLCMTESGVERISGPITTTCPAGTKRLLYAVTDVVLETEHETEVTTVEEAEKLLVTDSYEDLNMKYLTGGNT